MTLGSWASLWLLGEALTLGKTSSEKACPARGSELLPEPGRPFERVY